MAGGAGSSKARGTRSKGRGGARSSRGRGGASAPRGRGATSSPRGRCTARRSRGRGGVATSPRGRCTARRSRGRGGPSSSKALLETVLSKVVGNTSPNSKIRKVLKGIRVMTRILKEFGIADYERGLQKPMLQFVKSYVHAVFIDSMQYSGHANKTQIHMNDVELSISLLQDRCFAHPPFREVSAILARQNNMLPLFSSTSFASLQLLRDRYNKAKTADNVSRTNVSLTSTTSSLSSSLISKNLFPTPSESKVRKRKRKKKKKKVAKKKSRTDDTIVIQLLDQENNIHS